MTSFDATGVCVSSITAVGSLRGATTLLLIGLLSATSFAVTRSWDGRGRLDRSWTTAENWSGDTLPGMGDVALFDRGAAVSYHVDFPNLIPFGGDIKTAGLFIGSNTVTFQNPSRSNTGYNVAESIIVGYGPESVAVLNVQLRNMTAKRVFIGDLIYTNANGTLNVTNNGQLTVTESRAGYEEEFVVGYEGTGTLNITSGGKVILTGADGDIAVGLYRTGIVTVTGAGSTLSTARRLSVGAGNSGTLHVSAGGSVNSAIASIGSNDDVIIEGTGSIWTNTGDFFMASLSGGGRLDILGGGTVNNGTAYVGRSNVFDIVHVDGANSNWTNDEMYIGDEGRGAVLIENGGRVTSGIARVGQRSNGIGFVIVDTGSTWEAGQIIIGNQGKGFVDVIGGGRVNSSTLLAGFGSPGMSSTGEVRIDGEDSQWICGQIHIGYPHGEGLLEITNGGSLSGNNAAIGAPFSVLTAKGSALVDGPGSLWTLTDNLGIGLGLNGAGSLTITNRGTVSVGGLLQIGPTGEIHGDGNIVGNVQNGGLVSPRTSPGALDIDGDYTQMAGGELLIELAPASSYDQLLVTGNAALAGTLTVNLMEGFAPSIGQTFTILTADEVSGAFTTAVLPTVANLSFDVTYNAESVVVSVSSALPGDFNGDGTVGAADYVVWRKNDGTQTEYDTWRSNFAKTIGPGVTAGLSNSAAIPEPASYMLLVLAAAIRAHRRPRRRVSPIADSPATAGRQWQNFATMSASAWRTFTGDSTPGERAIA